MWSVCFVLILAFTIEIGIIAAIAVEIGMLMVSFMKEQIICCGVFYEGVMSHK